MIVRLGDIDLKRKPVEAQLFLCKPNKQIVAKMNESYNKVLNIKLGALNELNFSLPLHLEKHHKIEKNPNAQKIKGRYLIKLVLGNYEEYFIVTQVEKVGDDSEVYNITSLSLGLELNDKIIREYEAVSKTATGLLDDLLIDTIWSIGYIDSEFDMKRRGLEVSSSTVLELVFDVAKTFNALVVFDTINRKIDFRRPESVGLNKGLKIKYGKYLESINLEDNSEEIITRLKLYGKENITIREINPTGAVYIEDFRYFMYPYEEKITDDGYEVIQHSDYMSDGLCHHLLRYDRLLQEHKDDFSNLVAIRSAKTEILTLKETEKFNLETELKILLDDRDVLNTRIAKIEDEIDYADNNDEDTILLKSNLESLKNELNAKLIEIEAKRSQVQNKENEVVVSRDDLQKTLDDIEELKSLLSLENNFSEELIKERNQYVIEKEWQDNNIDNPEDLLSEGTKVFEDYKQQKITLKVDIVNFLSMITEQRNWDKLGIGDSITIEHERLGISFQAKITEIEYDFEESTINITISNVKDLYSNKDKFLEMLYKGYGSSTQISIDKWKWDLSMENNGAINELINNIWDANKQAILGAKDQVIELSDRGLIIRDPNDPSTYLVGLNGLIAITNDGGNTWKHAITGNGIVGERIYGKIYMGVNLALEDEDGVLKFQGSKGEIFDRNGNLVMKLGLVDENPDTFGLWSFNDTTRVKVDDLTGFSIEKRNFNTDIYPEGWEKVLWADQSDGTLYAHGLVAENIKIVNNIGKTILDSENNYLDIGDFENIVMDNKLTTIEKMQIITELYKIESGYKLMLEQAEKYKRSQRDDSFDTSSQFLSKTDSSNDLYSTTPLTEAYSNLITYISQYIKVTEEDPLEIDVNDPLTESTSEVSDRAEFILKFKDYYDEEKRLRNLIEDSLFYSGLNMGQFYNNIVIGEYGLIALRSDGKYRAWLNATNGLALQRWEDDRWVNKVYASIGNTTYPDGTLIAEDLVAKRLRIETKDGGTLLDVNSLHLDFSVLDSIILDNVIMSPEKITLSNQFKSITQQYNELLSQLDRYISTVYDDRDSFYYELDGAKDELVSARSGLTNSYNDLSSYLAPIFADMNAKTHIINDLNSSRTEFYEVWENFYRSYEAGRSKLADFLEKSSLQLGRNYNNTVIDAENGIVVTRGNLKNRTTLNATEGIMIEANVGTTSSPNWVKKFYVDLNGLLVAEDLQAKRLRIETSDGGILLDSDSLNLDFTKLNSIVLDDVIMSPEKVSLLNQFKNVTKQYNELISTINKYRTTIYNDRDSSYSGLDSAKASLDSSASSLNDAYNSLSSYLTPVFADMNAKTHIVEDLNSSRSEFYQKWENFYQAYENGRNELSDFLEKSSIQLGRNYNNTVIDAEDGVVVTRGDSMVRSILNATEGISIEQNIGTSSSPNWVKKFYVDTSGQFYSEDLAAIRLRIYSDEGDLLIDGNERKLYLNNFDIIGAGKITSEHVVTNTITANEGYIVDLTVNRLKTLGKDGEVNDYLDYIDISDNVARWVTGKITSKTQAKDTRGDLLYWTDSSRRYLTTEPTSYRAYQYDLEDIDRLKIGFQGSGIGSFPYTVWGVGDGVINDPDNFGDSGKGYLYKSVDKFSFKYNRRNNAGLREVYLDDNGVFITAGLGDFRADGQYVYAYADGGILRLEHSSGSSIELNSSGEVKLAHSNGSQFKINSSGLSLAIHGNIDISATGNVSISGSRIDLN